ncbi:MAG TPA: hypothetical protein DD379_12450 [Cyanobacteria bacterium UBA11162]|nr:hypothetical protein [Cyanobacteria bacterium UBA11162]
MYKYNPDRQGLSEVKILALEPWRLYPKGEELNPEFLRSNRSGQLRITHCTPIASIGSCFAREIKNWLKLNGYSFIETAQGLCAEAGSARYDRVYNTFTLRQEFERAFGKFEPQEVYWEFEERGDVRLLDPYRKGVAWENREEMHRELREHQKNVRKAFTQAEVLIITVGQAEIWYHKNDGYVYPLVPPVQVFDPAIHGFRLSSYEENLANLERTFELFTAHNPTGHIIITVSPVPLRATFRPVNSLVANMASKSILRAAVEAFVTNHPEHITYFPAYEVVMVAEKEPFKDDNRHVKSEVVDRIMQLFEDWFVEPKLSISRYS